MTLPEIKRAVDQGKAVYYVNRSTKVIKDSLNRYLIESYNGYCIALTWLDGKTLNGFGIYFFVDGDQ